MRLLNTLLFALLLLIPYGAFAQSNEGLRALNDGEDNWLWRPVSVGRDLYGRAGDGGLLRSGA